MIYLNGQSIEKIADTHSRFQTLLTMIPGGTEWIRWAITDTVIPALNITSEDELLSLIQNGLHSDADIRFNTFRLSLGKLISMTEADVEQLASFRNTSFDNEATLQNLLNRNNLISYNEMKRVADFILLEELNNVSIFSFPSFGELLAFSAFIKQLNDVEEAQKKQALVFALKLGRNVHEFIDLACFSIYSAQRLLPESLAPLMQNSEIQLYYDKLLPFTNHLLFTPNAGRGKNEMQLREEIKQLAGSNKFIGYATNASAVHNLIQNVNLQGQDGPSLQTQIESYMATIKNLVASASAATSEVAQDGKLITFKIENEHALALVGVDEAGNVYLLPETKLK